MSGCLSGGGGEEMRGLWMGVGVFFVFVWRFSRAGVH